MFFIIVIFVNPINMMVSVLVQDKANRLTEGLKMMGATNSSLWISWTFWWFLEMTLIAFGITLVGKLGYIFEYSDATVIFVWFWSFALSLSGLAMLISTS